MHRLSLLVGLAACAQPDVSLTPDVDGFSHHLATLDNAIASTEVLAMSGADWAHEERLAGMFLQRARLVGGYDDYDAALSALDRAFAIAPPGSGPRETEAAVLQSLHRLDEAKAALEQAQQRPLLDDAARARLLLLDAQIAWQSGLYDDSLEQTDEALSVRVTYDGLAFRAHQAARLGAFDRADAAYEEAALELPQSDDYTLAWVELQRGILDLDRDHLDDALDHFLAADARFPGWWLIHEHIAEVWSLQGDAARSRTLYIDVVGRTGHPEFIDALASLSRGAEREDLIDEAYAAYRDQLERHPEAAAGHALGHFMDFGAPSEALRLAEANLAARPNAEARMLLAQAALHADAPDRARAAIEEALATPWQTPELHDTAAEVFEWVGDHARAEHHAAQAELLRQ